MCACMDVCACVYMCVCVCNHLLLRLDRAGEGDVVRFGVEFHFVHLWSGWVGEKSECVRACVRVAYVRACVCVYSPA